MGLFDGGAAGSFGNAIANQYKQITAPGSRSQTGGADTPIVPADQNPVYKQVASATGGGDNMSLGSNYAATTPGINQFNYVPSLQQGFSNNPVNNYAGAGGVANAQAAFGNALAGFGSQSAQQEQLLIAQLQAQAAGGGVGQAQANAMFNQQAQQNAAAAASAAASQRGINPALAARQTANAAAAAGIGASQNAANYGLSQQQNAQQQLGGLLNSNINTGLGGANTAYGGAANTALGIGNGVTTGQSNQLNSAISGQNAQNTNLINASLGAQNINATTATNNAAINGKLAGGLINGVGAAGAAYAGSTAGSSAIAGLARGGRVPGEAEVKGDSPENDDVKALLSPDEIVIPRSAAQDKEKAKRFLDSLGGWKKDKDAKMSSGGFAGVAGARKQLADMKAKMAELEKKIGKAA